MKIELVLSLVSAISVVPDSSSSTLSGSGSATLHVCNRGFCFTKKEEPLDPSAYHFQNLKTNNHRNKRHSTTSVSGDQVSGMDFDFCSNNRGEEGSTSIDCELFHILGTKRVDEEFEAIECPMGMVDCSVKEEADVQNVADRYSNSILIEEDDDADAVVLEL